MDQEFTQYLLTLLPRYFGKLLPRQLETIAEHLERVHAGSGESLYKQGQVPDDMHFVVTGRLEISIRDKHGDPHIVSHASSGDCVGELPLLTGQPHAADVVVTRDTVLARLCRRDYERIVRRYPEAGLNLAEFALRNLSSGVAELAPRLRNIAIVPLHADVPVAEFGRRLEVALLRFGSTSFLESRIVHRRRESGHDPRPRVATGDAFLDGVFDQAEKARRFVIGVADFEITDWTRACIAHADRILLVADETHSPAIAAIEEALSDRRFGAVLVEKELVLLHPSRRVPPSGTARWLAARKLYRHSHVEWGSNRDFNRLARLLSGNAVTLVLGGGGARGLAQIGAIRAIREAGVPVDAVGGTSIGAVMGALVALNWDDERILQSCKRAFVDDRPLDDVTIPLFALLRGQKLARALEHYIGGVDIVDLWQPYFCVSTNLSRNRSHVHQSGTLWQAVLASISLPGLLPPVLMQGDVNVDGAVLDNLPVGLMKRFIGGSVIAVESSARVEYSLDAPCYPSPFQYFRSRLTGQRSAVDFPKLPSLLVKSTALGGIHGRGEIQDGTDLYLDPPVHDFGFFDWEAIYDIVEIGYRYTREQLAPWIEQSPALQRRDELLEFRWSSLQ